MLADQKRPADEDGYRSREVVMKEARQQLVQAMKASGRLFCVRVGPKAVPFTGDGFCADETFPISVFDAKVLGLLAAYT